MPVEIRVPPLGESIVEATVGRWTKKEGEPVSKDEILVELETDKITVEVAAQQDGVIGRIEKQEGETVAVDELLAILDGTDGKQAPQPAAPAAAPGATGPAAAPAATAPAAESAAAPASQPSAAEPQSSPAARALASEHGLDLRSVQGSGPNGRITKEDVMRAVEAAAPAAAAPAPPQPAAPAAEPRREAPAPAAPAPSAPAAPGAARDGRETRERMSRRRQTIARRLLEAQQTTANLTTFNEVDLSRVIAIRKRWQDDFVERHGVKLGFMSFFTKAVIGALRQFPRLNAEIQGDQIVLKHYYDIGIAVGAEEGLVVPVVRDADQKSFAELERSIGDLGKRARDGKLTLEELQGGTFTITNGGIFGSMLSTPILNPPQVGILGMHNIVERPVVVDGEVAVRPIMYVALTYDHRLVDGREAVLFLVAVKRMLEDPESMLLEA